MKICTKESFSVWWRAALTSHAERKGREFLGLNEYKSHSLLESKAVFTHFDFSFQSLANKMGLEFYINMEEIKYPLTYRGLVSFFENHNSKGFSSKNWNAYSNMKRFCNSDTKRKKISFDTLFPLLNYTNSSLVFDLKKEVQK